jgi:MFS family permease
LYWAINLGFSFAAVLGGFLAGVSFTLLFVGDAMTTLFFGALVWAYVPETQPAARSDASTSTARSSDRPSLSAPYRDRVFLLFIGLSFLVALVFQQFTVALPLDMTAHGLSPRAYGSLVAVNGVLIVVVQPLALRIVERVKPTRALALGALMIGVGFGMTALASAPPMYAASIVVWTLGEICMAPVTPTIVSTLAPAGLRGSYQGAMQIAFGGSSLVAPAVGSAVLGRFGGATLWSACVVAGMLAAVGLLALGRAPALALARKGDS